MSEQNEFSKKDISSLLSNDVFSTNRPITIQKNTTKETKVTKKATKSKRLYRPTSTKSKNYHLLAMMNEEEEESEEEEEEVYDFIAKRVKKEAVIIKKDVKIKKEAVVIKRKYDSDEPSNDKKEEPVLESKAPKKEVTSSSSDDSNSDDSDDNSSSEESSSESSTNSPIPPIQKPKFIPKSKRDKILSSVEQDQIHQKQNEEKLKQQQKRALESRALVAQVISLEQDKKKPKPVAYDEEYGEDKPDDNDEDEDNREEWKVREILRILTVFDDQHIKQQLHEEYLKRKAMTDEEIMQLQNNTSVEEKEYNAQRYYHRGAYYMDEETLSNDPNDIRNKAKMYAMAATQDDIRIKDAKEMNLPGGKQNKYFGFSGYSTKYKGLRMEDTTDKEMLFVPHVSAMKKKK